MCIRDSYQAFTNTYADLDYLRRVYEPSFLHEKVAVVDIATRPDCVGEDVVSLLCESVSYTHLSGLRCAVEGRSLIAVAHLALARRQMGRDGTLG